MGRYQKGNQIPLEKKNMKRLARSLAAHKINSTIVSSSEVQLDKMMKQTYFCRKLLSTLLLVQPIRKCVMTGISFPKKLLVRLVFKKIGSSKQLVPDAWQILTGPGKYVIPHRGAIEAAIGASLQNRNKTLSLLLDLENALKNKILDLLYSLTSEGYCKINPSAEILPSYYAVLVATDSPSLSTIFGICGEETDSTKSASSSSFPMSILSPYLSCEKPFVSSLFSSSELFYSLYERKPIVKVHSESYNAMDTDKNLALDRTVGISHLGLVRSHYAADLLCAIQQIKSLHSSTPVVVKKRGRSR